MTKKFSWYLFFIFLAEAMSLVGFFIPQIRVAGFFIIAIAAILLAVEKLEYGILFLYAELFIGSKGYLFFYEYEGALFSIRIALFLVVMSAWFGKVMLNWADISKAPEMEIDPLIKKSKHFSWSELLNVQQKKIATQAKSMTLKKKYWHEINFYFMLLFLSVVWGLINGVWQRNGFGNIFYDFNNWLYFVVIFPMIYVFKKVDSKVLDNFLKKLFILFAAAVTWLSLKTLILFFIFSRSFFGGADLIYQWVRDSGIGEITATGGGFRRIFIQSQIYISIALFIFSALALQALIKKQSSLLIKNLTILIICAAVVLASLSRSFWLGVIVGMLFFYATLILFLTKKWKNIIKHLLLMIVVSVAGFGLLFILAVWPYPPAGMFNVSIFKNRASDLSGEAAVSSRWNLLPNLWQEIKIHPWRGQGFGAEVTYQTNDPRILAKNHSGCYTTYAFEWGWLDIWLKLGFFGLVAYMALIIKIIIDGWLIIKNSDFDENKLVVIALLSGLIMLVTTSIVSPYLNHPLGISYLLIVALVFKYHKKLPAKN